MGMPGGDPNVQLHSTAPASDVFEYTTGASDIPLTELGGQFRFAQVVSGAVAASLAVKTIASGATWRVLTGLNNGDRLEPGQYLGIGSTGNGSTTTVKLRCYR